MAKLGFNIKREEIFSSLAAARKLIISRKLNPMLFIDPAASEDFEDLIKNDNKKDAVVIGLAPDKFNYEELTKAFRCTFKLLYFRRNLMYKIFAVHKKIFFTMFIVYLLFEIDYSSFQVTIRWCIAHSHL